MALKSDGTVRTWGMNLYGQLGIGITGSYRTTPVQTSGITNVTAITGGYNHSVALKGDGTVWTWGANSSGQLGDGTTTSRNTPVQVAGLSNVTAIASGGYYTLALKSDGTVWAWGNNSFGQLGDGTTTLRRTPVQVAGLSNVAAIGAGFQHTIAIKDDGTVWTWGRNDYGQLGLGTTDMSAHKTPAQVTGIPPMTFAAGGGYFSLIFADTSSPGNVRNFTVTNQGAGNALNLSWTSLSPGFAG